MAATPEQMTASMIENLQAKTGKNLAQWLDLAQSSKLAKHGELVKWLKGEHGIGHGYANLIAHKALAPAEAPAGDALVDAQYAGAKAALRPVYDALIALVRKLGPDVEIAPKKTYVSLRRSKQFALIQASTATRIDVGIQLKGVAPEGALEASGSFNAMVSHRVRISSLGEVNNQLRGWLKQAYESA